MSTPNDQALNVEIQRLNPGRWSRDRRQWAPGYVVAHVDGFKVSATSGKGWLCSCTNTNCQHLDAIATVLDPELLEELDADDITEFQQRQLVARQPNRRRRNRNTQEFNNPTAKADHTQGGDTK